MVEPREEASLCTDPPPGTRCTPFGKLLFDGINLQLLANLPPLALPHHVVHLVHPRNLHRVAQRLITLFCHQCCALPHTHHFFNKGIISQL